MADAFAHASSHRAFTESDLQILRSLGVDDHRVEGFVASFFEHQRGGFAYLAWSQTEPPSHSDAVRDVMQTLLHDMRRLLFVYPRSYIDETYVNTSHSPDFFTNGITGCRRLKRIVGIVLSAFVHAHRLIPVSKGDDEDGMITALQEMHHHYADLRYLHAFLQVKTSSLSESDSMEQYAVALRSGPQRVWMADPRYMTDKLHIWSKLRSSSTQVHFLDHNVLCTFWTSVIFYFCYVIDVGNVAPKCNNVHAAALLLTLYNLVLLEPLFTYASTLPLGEHVAMHNVAIQEITSENATSQHDLIRFTYAGTTYAVTGLISAEKPVFDGPTILICLCNALFGKLYLRTSDGSSLQTPMHQAFEKTTLESHECIDVPRPVPFPTLTDVYESR